tara:strand:- start:186 stop:770 length:585 start_codon:yes stop_codon:yes gene_type:complete
MQKKILLQIFLLTIILIISVVFFKIYFGNKNINNSPMNIQIEKKDLNEKDSNIMYNIEYISEDDEGNSYRINSKFGEIDIKKPEIILLKEVVAVIKLVDSEPINIYAINAIYNKNNYNTNFYEEVLVTHNDHNINSDNLDLDFLKNLATVSNNIIYKNLNTKLQADKMVIDLITKNSKIYMYDTSKKVKIVSIN